MGHNSTFISIYESNSVDSTPELLNKLSQRLTHVNIPHRFVSTTDDNRHWSYSTSQERIQYLADVRNKAMEPLQSADDNVRLSDWEDFTRVIFINDVIYKWESVVRLIATRLDEDETKAGEYDLACGLDFAISGTSGRFGIEQRLTYRSLRHLGRKRYLRYTVPNLLAIRQGPAFDRPDQEGEASRGRRVLEWSSGLPSQAIYVPASSGYTYEGAEAELEDGRQL